MNTTLEFVKTHMGDYRDLLPNTDVLSLLPSAVSSFEEGTGLLKDCEDVDYAAYLENNHAEFIENHQKVIQNTLGLPEEILLSTIMASQSEGDKLCYLKLLEFLANFTRLFAKKDNSRYDSDRVNYQITCAQTLLFAKNSFEDLLSAAMYLCAFFTKHITDSSDRFDMSRKYYEELTTYLNKKREVDGSSFHANTYEV